MHYIAVTATRNDHEYLYNHIQSVLNQTIPPATYIVVDDMSNPPVKPQEGYTLLRSNKPRYKTRGLNQSKAVNLGVERATQLTPGWGYLLKTDTDVTLPSDYMQKMIQYHQKYPKAGISSGKSNTMGPTQQNHRPSDAAKVFTRKCWEDIGGYTETNAFDTHATMKAILLKYMPSINTETSFKELRPNTKQTIMRWIESGHTRKRWGFPLWHTILAAAKNLLNGKPPIIGPLAMIIAHATYRPKYTYLPAEWSRQYALWELKKIMGVTN